MIVFGVKRAVIFVINDNNLSILLIVFIREELEKLRGELKVLSILLIVFGVSREDSPAYSCYSFNSFDCIPSILAYSKTPEGSGLSILLIVFFRPVNYPVYELYLSDAFQFF